MSALTEVLQGLVRADNSALVAGADLPMGTGVVVKLQDEAVKVVNLLSAPDLSGMADQAELENGNFYVLVCSIDGISLEGFTSDKRISVRGAPAAEPKNPWQPDGNQTIVLSLVSGKTI